MLKALELVGFKSFADKTRFEFPQGITAVVGPNGSGKSNVVDAIKWVLGEQSVKSLRGKEMADVIFNGSGSRAGVERGRNDAHHSTTPSACWRSTRPRCTSPAASIAAARASISSIASRAGCATSASCFPARASATEAYSVIEQGKVDVMLQSSPRDRRVIFEEAAGISRFKAKKVESLRRLERVEQNLLRLSDIVTEVENRLRSVRACRPQRRAATRNMPIGCKSCARKSVWTDWRSLSRKLEGLEAEIKKFGDEGRGKSSQADVLEARVVELDTALSSLNDGIRAAKGRGAHNRERIASAEATTVHERVRVQDLEEEIGRQRQKLAAMDVRVGDLRQQLLETLATLSIAEETYEQLTRRSWRRLNGSSTNWPRGWTNCVNRPTPCAVRIWNRCAVPPWSGKKSRRSNRWPPRRNWHRRVASNGWPSWTRCARR